MVFSSYKFRKSLIISGSLLLFSSLLTSCGTDECYDNRNSIPLAALYSSGPQMQQISIDSISVWGIGVPNDSMIMNVERNVKQINFPFRIDENESSFVIRYDALKQQFPGAPDDTLSFNYEPVPVFESASCGVFYRFDNVRVSYTHHVIDSVACPLGYIDNAPQTNLQIFFRTQSPD